MNEALKDLVEKGFYYHYKHDPAGSYDNYAYEVLGIAKHTEDGSYGVIYRPLYESTYLDVNYSIRPLGMFMESVTRDGVDTPRFWKIEDAGTIAKLEAKRDEMYPG